MSTVRGPGRPPIDPSELDPILDAVLRLAALKGSRRITFREIAAEADVSVGRVQHHFGTREKLIHRAFERYLMRVTERLEELRRRPGTATERMALMIDEVSFRHSWQRSHVWIDLLGRSSDSEAARHIANEVNDAWFRVIGQLVREGIETGEFSPRGSADDTAWGIIAAADGLTIVVVADGAEHAAERAQRRRRLLGLVVGSMLDQTLPLSAERADGAARAGVEPARVVATG